MRNLLLRFLINAVAIAVITSGLLPGIFIVGSMIPTIAIVALIFGVVNSLLKPIVRVLTCPLVLLTLGLFTFVINGAMLTLAASLAARFTVDLTHGQVVIENFGWAVLGALIVTLVDLILEAILIRTAPKQEIVVHVDLPPPPKPPDDDPFDFYDPKTGKIKRP